MEFDYPEPALETDIVCREADIDAELVASWALHAMDLYDQSGLHAAMQVIRDTDRFIQSAFEREAGAAYEDYAGVLTHFVQGLSGRKLNIEQGDAFYTDSETIYLPAVLAVSASEQDNFTLLKAMVAWVSIPIALPSIPRPRVICRICMVRRRTQ